MRWRRRLPAIVIVSVLLAVTMASPALADPFGDVGKALFGQSNPALSWIQLQDAHGVSVWQYELSIDRGNAITSADKWFWAKPVDAAWGFYRDGVVVAIWLLNWILGFGWMDIVAAAVNPIGAALQSTMGLLGLGGLFLTIAGIVGAIYVWRGRTATGVWELMMAVMVTAGLATFLANPAGLLLSKPDGLVYKVHDTSLGFVAAMSQTPELKGAGQTDAITSDLIVTFLRQPLEMVNFGVVIDGSECEAGYDEVLKSGPHAWGSEIRDKVATCSAKAGEWASTPSPSMFGTAAFLYPAVIVVLAIAIAIGGAVLMAGITLAYLSVKAAVTTVAGVLPGAARRPLLNTIADVIIALGSFLFAYVFLAVFLKAVQLMLGGSGDMAAPQRIFITDLLLIAGLVIFTVNRKRIKQSTNRLRELLASRPGGPIGAAGPPAKLNTAGAISAGANVAQLVRSAVRRRPPAAPSSASPSTGIVGVIGGGAPFSGHVDGGFGGAWDPHNRRPSSGGGGGGGAVPTLTGTILTGAAEVGLARATGGVSSVALTLLRAVRPRRRPELPPGTFGASTAIRRALPAGGSAPPQIPKGRSSTEPLASLSGRQVQAQLALPPGRSASGSAPRVRPAGSAGSSRPNQQRRTWSQPPAKRPASRPKAVNQVVRRPQGRRKR